MIPRTRATFAIRLTWWDSNLRPLDARHRTYHSFLDPHWCPAVRSFCIRTSVDWFSILL